MLHLIQHVQEEILNFATGSGAWYEFLVNSGGVITSQQSSTSDTWSSTILNNEDGNSENYTTSATTCYASDSVEFISIHSQALMTSLGIK